MPGYFRLGKGLSRHSPGIPVRPFARKQFGPQSDIDVHIEVDRSNGFNLHDLTHFMKRIEQRTGREVDVVSADVIKNANLAAAIEREKVLVYEREEY